MSAIKKAISLFRKNDFFPALLILEKLFVKNPKTFLRNISNALDNEDLNFFECSKLAQLLARSKKHEISVELYKLLISKEEKLEKQIIKEKDQEAKKKLISYQRRMDFSLGRDYNDLSITYVAIGDQVKAKDIILKAYNEDVKHQRLHNAATMPAYRNLSMILIWEAVTFYNKKENLPSFLMAWISVELSLRRLWFKLLTKKGYSTTKMRWLGKLDIGIVIENLYLLGKLTGEKNSIDTLRGRRNDIIHATGATPTRGETKKAIDLASLLHQKT